MQSWVLRKIHVSWLIASWCLGAVIGVIAVTGAPHGVFSGLHWLLVGVLTLVPLFFAQRSVWMMSLAIVSGLIVGLWRGSLGQVGLEVYEKLVGVEVMLSGRVLEDPDIDARDQTVLRLSDITIDAYELPGSVWVTMTKNGSIQRSDHVTVRGKMTEGFGGFGATIYRATMVEIERPVPGDVAVSVRNWFAERVRQHVPEPEADLGLGFLLGLRRALPVDLIEALKIAGLTHVIVASGYNLTILVRLGRRLFVRVSKYLAMLSSTMMIIGFMALTGLSPSMSRAGLVAGLSLAAWYYGRKIHPLVLLPFAAATTLLINPQYGWNDLGWQLSFASFAGVIVLAPLLQRYFFGEKEPGILRQVVGETFSAQVVTLPLILVAFGTLSNVALIANVLILPLVPLAMLLTFLTGLFAGIPGFGSLIAKPTEWLLSYMVNVAEWLAAQPWAQSEVAAGWWMVALSYGLIVLMCVYLVRKTGYKLRESNVVE